MRLEEISVRTERFRRQGHGRHELTVSASLSACRAGTLYGVRTVHDHTGHKGFHIRNITEIHHQVIVTVNIAALGQPNLPCSALLRFFQVPTGTGLS